MLLHFNSRHAIRQKYPHQNFIGQWEPTFIITCCDSGGLLTGDKAVIDMFMFGCGGVFRDFFGEDGDSLAADPFLPLFLVLVGLGLSAIIKQGLVSDIYSEKNTQYADPRRA